VADIPKRIQVDRAGGWLELEWSDGGVKRALLSELRQACPCALCEDLRTDATQNEGLHMITAEEIPSAELSEVTPVGNYAIQIRWSDGHDTGIYTYSLLKHLARDRDVSSSK
jgi:DUF971 family protein